MSDSKPKQTEKALQDAAWKLADEWHDRKREHVSVADLEAICPGFTAEEYWTALNQALERAAK